MAHYSLERYLNIRSADSPTFTPDGGRVAFLTNVTGVPQVWAVDAEGGGPEQLTFFPERAASPRHSPASRELAFEMDAGGNERFQLWHLSADGSELRSLTEAPETVHSLGDWSPDGRWIAYSANARDPRFFDAHVLDLASGEDRRVYAHDGSNFARAFSRDGGSVLVWRQNSSFDHDLFLVDIGSEEARHLTPHEGVVSYFDPSLSPDGRYLYALTDGDREFLALARLDLVRLRWTTVYETPWDVDGLRLSGDGRLAAILVNEGGSSRLRVLRLRDRKVVAEPALPDGIARQPDWSRDGRRIAFTFESPAQPADIWILDVRRNRARELTQSSRAGIPRETFVTPEAVTYPTFDGREVPGFLYRPASAARSPAIVWVHGGPESQAVTNFSPLIQYFVNRGYAVFAPNVRGSTGYGKAYHHLDDVEKRLDSVADLRHGAEWLRGRGDVDPDRIAVVGGSYGGYMVLASLTEHPEVWSAGVDIVGIANFVTFLENTGPWRRKWREAEYGSLERDRAFLERISPIRKADRIRAPLFVIHGKNDPRVPLGETEQIVEAVKRRGGAVEFLVFPDEGHGLVKIPNRVKGYAAAVDFLDRHMGG